MNQVQIAIIVIVSIIVLAIIIYYIYQENKFKKMIENNFNQAITDVIQHEKGLIFESQESEVRTSFSNSAKDKFSQGEPLVKLEQAEISFDSLLDSCHLEVAPAQETYFIKFDQISFPETINKELDHVIDLCWEKPTKIKALPEISPFSSKACRYYILEKGGKWNLFQKGNKYIIEGARLIVGLADNEGVISEFQLNNIYNELAKFSLHHDGHIRQSDSLLQIHRIQQQLKSLANTELNLGLYLVHKEDIEYRYLSKYFESTGFTVNNGSFEFRFEGNSRLVFKIRDENMQALNPKGRYRLLSINAKLHHHENPLLVIEKIFDFAEDYMKYFESRLLTTNKQLLGERDYLALEKQVSSYIATAKRQGAALGSDLIARVYP